MIIVEPINDVDIPSIGILYEQFWQEEPKPDQMLKTWDKIKTGENVIILKAIEEDHLVGVITGNICMSLYGNCQPFLVIEDLVVDKNHRRKGIGRKLMNSMTAMARQQGCNQVILITETDRKDAVSFYESLGFDSQINKGFKMTL